MGMRNARRTYPEKDNPSPGGQRDTEETIELAQILRLMGHPDRIRIVEELVDEEKDVNTLLNDLNLPGPRVSQHLSLLRAHSIVSERKEGRHHVYRLSQPLLADWVLNGLRVMKQHPNQRRDCHGQTP